MSVLTISLKSPSINLFFEPPIDFEPRTRYYQDLDGDGYGNPLESTQSTFQPKGYVIIEGDCDDNDNKVFSSTLFTFFIDKDHDGIGNYEQKISACSQPKGYSTLCCDCDDNDPTTGKGELKTYYRDNDKDGIGDLNFIKYGCKTPSGYVEMKSYFEDHDCDDNDPKIGKGTPIIVFV